MAGTYRPDRHGNIVELSTPPRDVPIAPRYMTKDAKAVWAEELPRVITCGATEADSSLLARYCQTEAGYRAIIKAGDMPPAAMLVELRRMGECLGVGGLRSRLAKMANTAAPASSPFTIAPSAKH